MPRVLDSDLTTTRRIRSSLHSPVGDENCVFQHLGTTLFVCSILTILYPIGFSGSSLFVIEHGCERIKMVFPSSQVESSWIRIETSWSVLSLFDLFWLDGREMGCRFFVFAIIRMM